MTDSSFTFVARMYKTPSLPPRVRIFSISVKTKQMSSDSKTAAVVVPGGGKGGAPDMAEAAGVQKMAGGGMLLSPLPLGGGKRKSRKISKKVKKMLKGMTPKQLKKLAKGGAEMEEAETEPSMEGARRRRGTKKTRRSSRKTRARKYF